ncbi:ABC transporter permease [Lentzea tibetensis]|uniref:Transport permease protein n=1 Tax=Lentzea tibetensis TaxID=2591470 RepID=A0A563ESA1_9PSEU|nr:ABC transporter permease [Lentzea tibetensis]TWP50530.1 ABC transporter permease [Lentzea tibetensis]
MTTDVPASATREEPIDYDMLAALDAGERPGRAGGFSASMSHLYRAMLRVKHSPAQIIDVTLFPLIMLLMFTFLFGGALSDGDTGAYLQFFLPGVLVNTVLMITMYVGMGLSSDAEKGVFDRFRSLPMWRPSAIIGPLLADAFRYTMASIMMLTFGLILGYRAEGGVVGVVLAVLVLIVFAFCLSWLWTLVGLVMRSEKAVTAVSMMVLMPLTFASNVYVNPATMPGWLEAFVSVNPISHVVTVVRGLTSGAGVTTGQLGLVLAEAAALLLLFGPLTMRKYRTMN